MYHEWIDKCEEANYGEGEKRAVRSKQIGNYAGESDEDGAGLERSDSDDEQD